MTTTSPPAPPAPPATDAPAPDGPTAAWFAERSALVPTIDADPAAL